MDRFVVLDEFHLTVSVSESLPDGEVDDIRRVLDSAEFGDRLLRMIRLTLAVFPPLAVCRIEVSR